MRVNVEAQPCVGVRACTCARLRLFLCLISFVSMCLCALEVTCGCVCVCVCTHLWECVYDYMCLCLWHCWECHSVRALYCVAPIFTDSYNISTRRNLGDYLQPPHFTDGEIKGPEKWTRICSAILGKYCSSWTSASSSLKWGFTHDGVVWGTEDK